MTDPTVYTAEEVAKLFGISRFSVYEAARRADTPIGQAALKVGRRIVWPRHKIDALLGAGAPTAPSVAVPTTPPPLNLAAAKVFLRLLLEVVERYEQEEGQ